MSRDLITWVLGYALIGFVLDWAARHVLDRSEPKEIVETAVPIVLWPVAVLIGVGAGFARAWRRRKVG